ncbi:outer membrane protein assembly factor BamD [Lichenihabitans sp. PAMC28606]|uniref:outer membrane protein assembly factor BamD n=1 Tax=Lichenihabitans sp. PAMC28606 TaxID=2880932 RepID=UPI001D0B29DE|nr:outer membrane protein assembly factor BamD [Lichenihabitans sp. PAMC28606]UDL94804.1 outer membrane protein assembly factor BamD [Lichenihabitans sp. PAMC28606]
MSTSTVAKVSMMAIIALAMPLAGCSSLESFNPFGAEKYETKILPDVPADDIYNQGLARLGKKDTEGAAKKFSELDKQYPYSDYSRKGLLMSTYAQYQAGNYDDAIASGGRYYSLYPTSPDAPYALYMEAMSYYNQIPDISRDQKQSEKALDLFNQIATKYPNSEYASDAKYKIQVTRDQIAGKEMSVGRFYLARHNYVAAINRFRTVIGQYQTTRHTEEALARLTEAYMALGITNEAQTAAAVLGHNFPDSQWYKDSFALLQTGGLEPREDTGSIIYKTFHNLGLT